MSALEIGLGVHELTEPEAHIPADDDLPGAFPSFVISALDETTHFRSVSFSLEQLCSDAAKHPLTA